MELVMELTKGAVSAEHNYYQPRFQLGLDLCARFDPCRILSSNFYLLNFRFLMEHENTNVFPDRLRDPPCIL